MSTTKKDQISEKQLDDIRIIYSGESEKLTARGKGLLSFELAVNETTGGNFIRIAANSQGGTCSFEWINLQAIEDLLEKQSAEELPFSAILFSKLYVSRSANNHGYLAAILKKLRIIEHSTEHPTQLLLLSFKAIKDKIDELKQQDIDLPDRVAADLAERTEKKKLRKKEKSAAVASDKPKKIPANKKAEKSS